MLARCDNRAAAAREHASSGRPDDWLAPSYLNPLGVKSVAFDFFVNWTTLAVSREVWTKRILVGENNPIDVNTTYEAIKHCDGSHKLNALVSFGRANQCKISVFLLRESAHWLNAPPPIFELVIPHDGSNPVLRNPPLTEVMDRIRFLSGGPVRIGNKGLYYANTTLECFLSKTDAAWPGDVDMVLINDDMKPLAIIEFKKHTLDTPLGNQTLAQYYPNPDRRKYDRIAHLSAALSGTIGHNIPIVVVFYPTRDNETEIRLELIGGNVGSLNVAAKRSLPLPKVTIPDTCAAFTKAILDWT